MSSFEKRLESTARQTDKAVKTFLRLEADFIAAAQADRELHDEIQVEIDRLQDIQKVAQGRGLYNQVRAERVRELFL